MYQAIDSYGGSFHNLIPVIRSQLQQSLIATQGVLFRTRPVVGLFDVYLDSFEDPFERQYHNCSCCRNFIERYGALVTISDTGKVKSALWNNAALPLNHNYRETLRRLNRAAVLAQIEDQFSWHTETWGLPEAGGFEHLWTAVDCVLPPARTEYDANRQMAVKRESYKHLSNALKIMSGTTVQRALELLQTGVLYRSEKVLPMAEFLNTAFVKTRGLRGEVRERAIWQLVSTAPAAWCTPRASVFGALVEDLQKGMPYETVASRHAQRMNPLNYMRPEGTTSGNIAQAEKVVAQLGLTSALRRRFAAAHELVAIWRASNEQKVQGVFGHLHSTKSVYNLGEERPQRTFMTFAKFRRDVLPLAREIKAWVPRRGDFCAFTTATDPSAPPILKWDSAECRNPFAWYLYDKGSFACRWNLERDSWADVVAISELPARWDKDPVWASFGNGALFVLKDCQDQHNQSLALFPECLRGDLHSVRATIEAYSKSKKLEALRPTVQHAAGLRFNDNSPIDLQVCIGDTLMYYTLDRWE